MTDSHYKEWGKRSLLVLVPILAAAGLLRNGPVPQSLEYHQFADQRTLFGIPNFWEVFSNLPFLIVGLLGLATLLRGHPGGVLPPLRPAYFCFFLGTALIGLGSAYYHFSPNHATLVWDRLPMTMGFMAFLAIVVGEHFNPRIGARILGPLLSFGILSVVYWAFTEKAGRGDLRLYFFVQFVPIVFIPIILLAYPSVFNRVRYFWGVLGFYALAKGFEYWDFPIYRCGELLGGHALKHLTAAVATFFVWLAMVNRVRRPVNRSGQGRDLSPQDP